MKREHLLNCLSIMFVIGLIIHQAAAAFAAPGDLDSTFGIGGKVMTETGYAEMVHAVALQPDGKIVVAGEININGSKGLVTRYNADGSLDQSFGFGGLIADAAHGGHSTTFTAVLVQPDGKIVAAGFFTESVGCMRSQAWIARYNPNGSNDTTFGGGDGKVEFPYVYVNGCPVDSFHYSLALQNDGKILAAGTSKNSSLNFDFAVTRLNTDGSLDTSFNQDGLAMMPIGSSFERAQAVAVRSDGKIVLAGYSQSDRTQNTDFAVVMLTSQGLYDWNFGGTGKVTTDTGGEDYAFAVAFQDDGKILAAGLRSGSGDEDFSLARYNENGSLDGRFGFGGKVVTDFGSPHDIAFDIALQSNGKAVAVGRGSDPNLPFTGQNFAVSRYSTAGALDATFGSNGKQMTDFSNSDDGARAVVIQTDGKIVVAGYGSNSPGNNSITLARYLP